MHNIKFRFFSNYNVGEKANRRISCVYLKKKLICRKNCQQLQIKTQKKKPIKYFF